MHLHVSTITSPKYHCHFAFLSKCHAYRDWKEIDLLCLVVSGFQLLYTWTSIVWPPQLPPPPGPPLPKYNLPTDNLDFDKDALDLDSRQYIHFNYLPVQKMVYLRCLGYCHIHTSFPNRHMISTTLCVQLSQHYRTHSSCLSMNRNIKGKKTIISLNDQHNIKIK